MSFQFTAYNTIAFDEIAPERMSSANAFYSTLQQLMLSFGICTAAATLHVSTELTGRSVPGFVDFSAAFWVVTAISICSVFANSRFDRHAGRQMSGAR
jgi:hypothetical protein